MKISSTTYYNYPTRQLNINNNITEYNKNVCLLCNQKPQKKNNNTKKKCNNSLSPDRNPLNYIVNNNEKNLEYIYTSNNENNPKNNAKRNQNNYKTNENSSEISPYITSGKILQNYNYSSKYDLSNFIKITENGKTKILGEGSLAKVILALNKIDNKYYAIKHMSKSTLSNTTHSKSGIFREIDYQSKISHRNIVKLLNVTETEKSYYLVMEYADSGSLFRYICKRKFLSESEAFRLFIQVANAIYFLHKNDYIHRDIKPENLLLFSNFSIVKLCDFGWCCHIKKSKTKSIDTLHTTRNTPNKRNTFCGTVEYMSPEVIKGLKYGKEIDMWGMGILLYEMIHGFSPFNRESKEGVDHLIMEKIKDSNKNSIIFKRGVSREIKELILALLDPIAERRMKIEEVFNSQFVKKYEAMGIALNINFNINNKDNEIYEKNKNKYNKNKYIDNINNKCEHFLTQNNNDNIQYENTVDIDYHCTERNYNPYYSKNNSLYNSNMNICKINNKQNKKMFNKSLDSYSEKFTDDNTNHNTNININNSLIYRRKIVSSLDKKKGNKNKSLSKSIESKKSPSSLPKMCKNKSIRINNIKVANYANNIFKQNNVHCMRHLHNKPANIYYMNRGYDIVDFIDNEETYTNRNNNIYIYRNNINYNPTNIYNT